jgi:hypothetical protein
MCVACQLLSDVKDSHGRSWKHRDVRLLSSGGTKVGTTTTDRDDPIDTLASRFALGTCYRLPKPERSQNVSYSFSGAYRGVTR